MNTSVPRRRLAAEAIYKAYGRTEALRGASMVVEPGEIVAVTGPSGCGKSTLLLCLAGIIRPQSGRVRYGDQVFSDLSETQRTLLRRREFGVVLQFGQLVPELTACQNVAIPLLLEKHRRADAYAAARAWLDRLGVAELADATPAELSGGEVQRVAIARALVMGPRVVFADEPTGALDTVGGEAVLAAMLSTVRTSGAALVLVTHDNRVAAVADREVRMRDGVTDSTLSVAP